MDWDVVTTVVTMPLNLAFWAWLMSHPLRLFFHGRAHVIGSLIAGLAILASIILFKTDLSDGVRIAGAMTAPCVAIAFYSWWNARSQSKKATTV